jgi:hypothetical protein
MIRAGEKHVVWPKPNWRSLSTHRSNHPTLPNNLEELTNFYFTALPLCSASVDQLPAENNFQYFT